MSASETMSHSADLPLKDAKPIYEWKSSFRDWFKQLWSKDYSDSAVEGRLLSYLPFFPSSDGKRVAKIIDTDLGNGDYIHEFFVENIEKHDPSRALTTTNSVKDIVLVHGYAASLGLFIENFNDLTSIPGVRLHAIDLPGFGLSSRPKYPSFSNKTKEDIYQNEDWFIDRFEQWRKKRGIDRFILIGHSFGGYLSCAYTMKYNRNLIDAATGMNNRMVEKLVLVSPVGLERHEKALVSLSEGKPMAHNDKKPVPSEELTMNQEAIVHGQGSSSSLSSPLEFSEEPSSQNTSTTTSDVHSKAASKGFSSKSSESDEKSSKSRSIMKWMWNNNFSPFTLMRNAGPARSKMISYWTSNRFSHVYYSDPVKFQSIHDYFYRVFNANGSGEYAITRILGWGALAKLPLLDRCPDKFVQMNLPTLWLYGDRDWMDSDAGATMTQEINQLANSKDKNDLAYYGILPKAGHHLYMDNSKAFAKEIFKFLDV